MTALRILHVFDHSLPLHSGYTFRSASIVREQQRLGWTTLHLTSTKQEGATTLEEDADGLHFYRTPPGNGLLDRLPAVNNWAVMRRLESRLEQLVRELKPDLLHAHSPVLNAFPALHVGRRHGLPVVYEVRGFWEDAAVDHGTQTEGSLRYRLSKAMETRAVRQADQVTTICEGLRGDLVARGIDAGKISIIPNAVDVQRFQWRQPADEALRARLGLAGHLVIGFVGSFYAYEGLDLLIGALPRIREQLPQVKLLLVGGGAMDAALKQQTRSMGLESAVVFTGRVPHAEVDRYYDQIDLLAYPRHPMRLTELVTPLKPLEAMAQGHLLIASDVGGHKELIQDGCTGVLFKAGALEDLAAKAVATLQLADGGQALRVAGREFVERERTWSRSVNAYQAVYSRALGRDCGDAF
jgi:PEP-CTERM/exosortase A-associated glycosyltransferase